MSLSCSVWAPWVRSCSLKCRALLQGGRWRKRLPTSRPLRKREEPFPSTVPTPVPVSILEMLVFTANLPYVFGQSFTFSRKREGSNFWTRVCEQFCLFQLLSRDLQCHKCFAAVFCSISENSASTRPGLSYLQGLLP